MDRRLAARYPNGYLPRLDVVFVVVLVFVVVFFVFVVVSVLVVEAVIVVGVVVEVVGLERRHQDAGSAGGLGGVGGAAGFGGGYVVQKWRPHRGQTQN